MSTLSLTLRRRYFSHGTFGELFDQDGEQLAVTVESPWNNNQPNISCIPEGEYTLRAHHSPRHGDCLVIESPSLGVTANGPSLRTHCLIHAANIAAQLQGCIAPGYQFGFYQGEWAVTGSKAMVERLLELVGDQVIDLHITKH